MWQRLIEWYGLRLAEQYGEMPPEDWCAVVDAADNNAVLLVLSQIRKKHTTYPPTFPEFAALFEQAKAPTDGAVVGPPTQERLREFVQRRYQLTRNQLRTPWTYIGATFDTPGIDGKMRHNHGVEITGVIVPADGDCPGYKVMAVDMEGADL